MPTRTSHTDHFFRNLCRKGLVYTVDKQWRLCNQTERAIWKLHASRIATNEVYARQQLSGVKYSVFLKIKPRQISWQKTSAQKCHHASTFAAADIQNTRRLQIGTNQSQGPKQSDLLGNALKQYTRISKQVIPVCSFLAIVGPVPLLANNRWVKFGVSSAGLVHFNSQSLRNSQGDQKDSAILMN